MQTQHLRPIFLLEEDYSKSPITILQSSIKVTDKTPEGGLRRHPVFFLFNFEQILRSGAVFSQLTLKLISFLRLAINRVKMIKFPCCY